jgi:Rrf2 family protein
MSISTRGRYGIQLMIDLALHRERGPVTLKDIAGRQGISEKYLWQMVSPLKTAGLIDSVRGARGGYVLIRPAESVSVYDIVSALEGPVLLTDTGRKPPDGGGPEPNGAARLLWRRLENTLAEAMRAIRLDELAQEQRTLETGAEWGYCI